MRKAKYMLTNTLFLLFLSCIFGNFVEAGWEWQNPIPQGNTLRSVWGSSGNNVLL